MSWPSPSDFQEAIQNPASCFADPELRNASPVLDLLGLPRPISGSFASVYQVNCNGRMYAVRCLLRDYPDIEKRYTAISDHLRHHRLQCMVNFLFIQQGMRVRGNWYPILKMEWADGESLNTYCQRNLNSPQTILALARKFLKLAADLRQASIAHGDLQHGNILVSNGELRLVDYDGMYVPALNGMLSNELGQRNYQHPNRTEKDFGLYLDNFSEWIIFASLVALGTKVKLPLGVNIGSDNLLFRKEDFDDPGSSLLLNALEQSSDSAIQLLSASLVSFIYTSDLSRIPQLEESAAYFSPIGLDSAGHNQLPSWLEGAVGGFATNVDGVGVLAPSEVGSSWVFDHIEVQPTVHLSGSCTVERYLIFGTSIVAVCLLAVIAIGALVSTFAVSIIGFVFLWITFCSVALVLIWRYWKIPEVKEKYALTSQRDSLRKEKVNTAAGLQQLFNEKRNLLESQKQRVLELTDKQHESPKLEILELNKVAHELQQTLADVALQTKNLNQACTDEVQNALKDIQRQQIAQKLLLYDIGNAKINGIGRVMKSRLLSEGIQTAADISDIFISNYQSGGYFGEIAYIVVPGRGKINVDGIGPTKARAILAWRRDVESAIQGSLSQTLPRSQEMAIKSKYAAALQALANREPQARRGAEQKQSIIRTKFAQERKSMAAQLADLQREFEEQNLKLLERIDGKGKELRQRQWDLTRAQRAVDAYLPISFFGYLKRILFLVR